MQKKMTAAEKIYTIVSQFDVSGERVTREFVERRHGSKGYGFYVIVDVAYEGQRVNCFKSVKAAQEWADEMAASC